MRTRLLAAALAAALAFATPAPGQTPAAVAPEVAAAVRARVAERWGVDPASVVVELSLASGAWPPAAARDVVLVGSGSGGEWVVRSDVPGDPGVRARAGVAVPVTVAARALPRGHQLAPSDLAPGTELRWGPPGAAEAVAEAGWLTLRAVAEGETLRPPVVQPAPAVRPGEQVEVMWLRGRVAVKVPGTAAGSAPLGGEVAVRTGQGRRLTGVVVAPGVVDVTQRGGA